MTQSSKRFPGRVSGLDEGAWLGVVHGPHGLTVRLPDAVVAQHLLTVGVNGVDRCLPLARLATRWVGTPSLGPAIVVDVRGDLSELIGHASSDDPWRYARFASGGCGMNVLDPDLFPARDWCVSMVAGSIQAYATVWNPNLETALLHSLRAMYEYNAHPDTRIEERLSLWDLPKLVSDDPRALLSSASTHRVASMILQRLVMSRVGDDAVRNWFSHFWSCSVEERSESLAPLLSLLASWHTRPPARDALRGAGFPHLLEALSAGTAVLTLADPDQLGLGPAALLGAASVLLCERELLRRAELACGVCPLALLVVDDFSALPVVPTAGMLPLLRRHACAAALGAASISGLPASPGSDGDQRSMLSRMGTLLVHRATEGDSFLLAAELGGCATPSELVELREGLAFIKSATSSGVVTAGLNLQRR